MSLENTVITALAVAVHGSYTEHSPKLKSSWKITICAYITHHSNNWTMCENASDL